MAATEATFGSRLTPTSNRWLILVYRPIVPFSFPFLLHDLPFQVTTILYERTPTISSSKWTNNSLSIIMESPTTTILSRLSSILFTLRIRTLHIISHTTRWANIK